MDIESPMSGVAYIAEGKAGKNYARTALYIDVLSISIYPSPIERCVMEKSCNENGVTSDTIDCYIGELKVLCVNATVDVDTCRYIECLKVIHHKIDAVVAVDA